MTKYQLGKLVKMAGGVASRKRLQKTVHLLQAAGCQFNLEFRLHHYGPYSSVLAERIDWMTKAGLLIETSSQTEVGTQYNYNLNESVVESLDVYETTPSGAAAKAEMDRFEGLVLRLRDVRPRVLELASTLVAFFQSEKNWERAQSRAAEFKGENRESPNMREARKLAAEVMDSTNAQHG